MKSSSGTKIVGGSDQEVLRELLNLPPNECLDQIAKNVRSQLDCETACILIWRERPLAKNGLGALITAHDDGMPELVKKRPADDTDMPGRKAYSEIYEYEEGITGGYIFANQNVIRARVDWENKSVYDDEAGKEVILKNTNWHNMEEFRKYSLYQDFRSLLGMPLVVRSQQIGVVKLINKLDGNGALSSSGFSHDDLKRADAFLSTIEQVVETKTNEQQFTDLFEISKKVISADFDYYKLLEEVAANCANTLNLRACVIRLFDGKQLAIKGNSLRLASNLDFDTFEIAARTAATKQIIEFHDESFFARDQPQVPIDITLPDSLSSNTRSILAVPVIYQDKVIGVIECYTFLQRAFSRQQVDTVLAYGTLIGALFQRHRIAEAIDGLTEPFSLLSNLDRVFSSIIRRIERYLDTRTVSIWEKKATQTGFEFKLVNASTGFEEKYQKRHIHTLSETSVTAQVANTNEIKHLDKQRLEKEVLEHREFIKENGLESLTIIPISIGKHVNAVIDIFYGEDKLLLKEDENFLRLLAGKAAAALWSKKLMVSYRAMSDLLWSAPNLEYILDQIVYLPREVLYADLVIVFPYDFKQQQFLPPRWSGEPREKRGIFEGEGEKEDDFVNLMLQEQRNPLYLNGTDEYKEFCQYKGSIRPWTESDFWHREGIQSMAAVRLEDRRQRPVGVMFFNYRTPFEFEVLTRQVIESFASQASLALVNASFNGMRIQDLVTERATADRLSKLILSLEQLDLQLSILQVPDKSPEGSSDLQVPDQAPQGPSEEYLTDASIAHETLRKVHSEVSQWRSQVLSESAHGPNDIEHLINDSLDYLAARLEGLGISPQLSYAPEVPPVWCYPQRIQSLLIQLLSLLLDASRSRSPSLSIKTWYQRAANIIEIRMALTGGRVPDHELVRILWEPMSFVAHPAGRLAFCEILAFSNQGEVDISETPDGLLCRLRLRLD